MPGIPSEFGRGFIYPAGSPFVLNFHLAMPPTKKCSDVTLGPSKDEEEASLQHTPPWQSLLGVTDSGPESRLVLEGGGSRDWTSYGGLLLGVLEYAQTPERLNHSQRLLKVLWHPAGGLPWSPLYPRLLSQ